MVRAVPEVAVVVSVDGLLDAHEVAVHARVDSPRERAARVAVELGAAEVALEHGAITRATLAAAISGSGLDLLAQDAGAAEHGASAPTVVPMWRMGQAVAHLPVRRLSAGVAGGSRRADTVAGEGDRGGTRARGERGEGRGAALQAQAVVARGWLTEPMPGAFALAAAAA